MGDLAGVDDAQTVNVPAHGVADLMDPPIMVVAESDVAPVENARGFCHECDPAVRGISGAKARGLL